MARRAIAILVLFIILSASISCEPLQAHEPPAKGQKRNYDKAKMSEDKSVSPDGKTLATASYGAVVEEPRKEEPSPADSSNSSTSRNGARKRQVID